MAVAHRAGAEQGSTEGEPVVAPMRISRLRVAVGEKYWRSDEEPGPNTLRLVTALTRLRSQVEHIHPIPAGHQDLIRAHDERYVVGILQEPPPSCSPARRAGIQEVLGELGVCHAAAVAALEDGVAGALSPGAHDAFWDSPGRGGPFNGLMVSATRLLHEGRVERIAIVDTSPQHGSGIQSIIDGAGLAEQVLHVSFGKRFQFRRQAQLYLARIRLLESELRAFHPSLVYYQAAAGSHVSAPCGGVLGTDQMRRRDAAVLGIARRLGLPLVWTLDGETSPAPPPEVAVEVHLNTVRETFRTFSASPLG